MRITIIETGRAPAPLSDIYPRYPDMFSALLLRVDDRLRFDLVALPDGDALPDPGRCEAVLITGSPLGVYDQAPWMDQLRDFIRAAAEAGTPMIGVCFGHQLIADALGGEVRKSEKGWGIGRHAYTLLSRETWMREAVSGFSLVASHQDQVITPPPEAVTLASSAHTAHAMLVYRGAPILTLQGHPEFTDAFAAALYNARRGRSLSDEMVDAAIDSLAQPEDSDLVAEWILAFLRGGLTARRQSVSADPS
jgi:GMP synthase-like glutamine amidotransferase